MKVLFTAPVFPPDLGGPAIYVPAAGRFLRERGHEVRVVAFCSDPEPSGYPFDVFAIPRGPLPLRYLRAFFKVWRHARWADVVYVHEHLALLHVLAGKLARKPVVIRIMVDGAWEISHRKGWCGDDDIDSFQTKDYDWRVRLVRSLQRRWWGWCSRIISCSEYLRQILIQHHDVAPDKVERIYNAYNGPTTADISQTPQEARAELGLREGPRYLLTICRLMVWKGVDGILRALRELPDDVELLVAGDGDMEAAWKDLARELGVEERVHFLGNRPYAQIPLLLRAAEVFVLNSRYEGLSHTLLEATALGTPSVATGVCGNPEVIRHEENGLLVPAQDDGALAEALNTLLADRDRQERFRAAGLARMVEFDADRNFDRVEALLAEVAGIPNPAYS